LGEGGSGGNFRIFPLSFFHVLEVSLQVSHGHSDDACMRHAACKP